MNQPGDVLSQDVFRPAPGRLTLLGYLGILIGAAFIVVDGLALAAGAYDPFGALLGLFIGMVFVIGSYRFARRVPRPGDMPMLTKFLWGAVVVGALACVVSLIARFA